MLAKVLMSFGISAVIYFVIAFGLILSQPLRPLPPNPTEGLAFETVIAAGRAEAIETGSFTARDGTTLSYGWVHGAGSDPRPLVVMVHGSGWYGGQWDRLAANLSDVAEVKTLTLRGHGAAPARRGDLDYIGQFEDDIADLLAREDPARKVLLVGHSSGGGLVVRFAGGEHGEMMDGAVLIAPFLQHNAPTTRPNSGGWAHVLTRRIIGLSMLNNLGIHALDNLKIIQFNMPKAVLDGPLGGYATTAYSWRLNTSYAPRRDYESDIAALPPFTLVSGAKDEAMIAEAYAPLMTPLNGQGRYVVIDGAAHLDVIDHSETETAIRDALDAL